MDEYNAYFRGWCSTFCDNYGFIDIPCRYTIVFFAALVANSKVKKTCIRPKQLQYALLVPLPSTRYWFQRLSPSLNQNSDRSIRSSELSIIQCGSISVSMFNLDRERLAWTQLRTSCVSLAYTCRPLERQVHQQLWPRTTTFDVRMYTLV